MAVSVDIPIVRHRAAAREFAMRRLACDERTAMALAMLANEREAEQLALAAGQRLDALFVDVVQRIFRRHADRLKDELVAQASAAVGVPF